MVKIPTDILSIEIRCYCCADRFKSHRHIDIHKCPTCGYLNNDPITGTFEKPTKSTGIYILDRAKARLNKIEQDILQVYDDLTEVDLLVLLAAIRGLNECRQELVMKVDSDTRCKIDIMIELNRALVLLFNGCLERLTINYDSRPKEIEKKGIYAAGGVIAGTRGVPAMKKVLDKMGEIKITKDMLKEDYLVYDYAKLEKLFTPLPLYDELTGKFFILRGISDTRKAIDKLIEDKRKKL